MRALYQRRPLTVSVWKPSRPRALPPVAGYGRARRVAFDLQDRDERLEARDCLGDALLRRGILFALQRLMVVAVRVGALSELLVGASNVEDNVAVRREAIGRQEVLEGTSKVATLVPVRSNLELELGLVGEVVGVCGTAAGELGAEDRGRHERNAEGLA